MLRLIQDSGSSLQENDRRPLRLIQDSGSSPQENDPQLPESDTEKKEKKKNEICFVECERAESLYEERF